MRHPHRCLLDGRHIFGTGVSRIALWLRAMARPSTGAAESNTSNCWRRRASPRQLVPTLTRFFDHLLLAQSLCNVAACVHFDMPARLHWPLSLQFSFNGRALGHSGCRRCQPPDWRGAREPHQSSLFLYPDDAKTGEQHASSARVWYRRASHELQDLFSLSRSTSPTSGLLKRRGR